MDKVNIGVVGLGGRGLFLLDSVILEMSDINVLAVCDLYEDRAAKGVNAVKNKRGKTPVCTTNYKDVLAIREIDAVIITSSWADHINIAIEAMNMGKYVGFEVGGAYSIEACWDIVKAYEKTKVPCMMLENCCYGRRELMLLNMVKMGLLGDIVHCEGSYTHDLREEIVSGEEKRHYRIHNYLNRNAENYPTHEIGPLAKILNINRGNRIVTLTSMSSKSAGLKQYIKANKDSDFYLYNANFEQGDIITTCIKCAHGETITIVLDTSLPAPYSRRNRVIGTKGRYNEDNHSMFLDGIHNSKHDKWQEEWGNADEFYKKYDHPIWSEYIGGRIHEGHGGMDWLVLRAFFESVKKGVNTPIDVYDAATYMCITPLSENSIALGSMPVAIPDFTNGKWINREPVVEGKYCLDRICIDFTTNSNV